MLSHELAHEEYVDVYGFEEREQNPSLPVNDADVLELNSEEEEVLAEESLLLEVNVRAPAMRERLRAAPPHALAAHAFRTQMRHSRRRPWKLGTARASTMA